MSLQFSDPTNKKGIIETIVRNCKSNATSYPLTEMTADVNLALDCALAIIFKSSGKWQFDDYNHTDYPMITTNLVAGQRDYPFVTDQSGNLILDVYKVMVKTGVAATDTYVEIYPVDQQSDEGVESMYDGLNAQGIPSRYDKTASSIFLDSVPSLNVDDGLQMFINRESTYFTTADTTKKPGFSGLFHEYLAIRPSYFYALRNGLANKDDLEKEMIKLEKGMEKHYRDRSKDERPVITSETINSV